MLAASPNKQRTSLAPVRENAVYAHEIEEIGWSPEKPEVWQRESLKSAL